MKKDTKVINEKEKYRFNKKEHLHEILVGEIWKPLTGCTTVLSVLAKPALISWAANMTAGYLQDKLEIIKNIPSEEEWKMLLDEARKAHVRRKTEAGDYGTRTHESISSLIGMSIKKHGGFIPEAIVDLSLIGLGLDKSVKNFIDWAAKNKVKFLESEKNIYSEKLFIGGIVDMICEIDGQLWVGDIKTRGSGIYPDHFFQCAGYNIMLEEMGLYPKVTGYLILNLKESGEMLEKRSVSNEENRKIFINCLEIYRQQEKLKNNTIK